MQRFSSRRELASTLAADVATTLRLAVAERGEASLVVSGGSTPVSVFQALRQHELPWHRVLITLADERWVAPEAADSNERLVRSELLREQAAVARFVPLKNAAETAEEGVAACANALAQLPERLDVVILGMGDDGHTASLFPNTAALAEGLREDPAGSPCVAVRPLAAPHPRMSLTLGRLLACRRLLLHIVGDAKLRTLEEAQSDGPVQAMPMRAVLRQRRVSLEIYWAP